MRSISGRVAMAALAGSFVLGWSARFTQDAIAQARKTIPVTRIYTGPNGESRAEQVNMALEGSVSEMMKATGVQFSKRSPTPNSNEWHPGPRRQYVITLSGRAEVEVGDGKKIAIGPGQIDLIEDTTGKGHITRNLGPEDRVVVTIPLAN